METPIGHERTSVSFQKATSQFQRMILLGFVSQRLKKKLAAAPRDTNHMMGTSPKPA